MPTNLWRCHGIMRDKIEREEIRNVTVLDGMCEGLSYEDNIPLLKTGLRITGDSRCPHFVRWQTAE